MPITEKFEPEWKGTSFIQIENLTSQFLNWIDLLIIVTVNGKEYSQCEQTLLDLEDVQPSSEIEFSGDWISNFDWIKFGTSGELII